LVGIPVRFQRLAFVSGGRNEILDLSGELSVPSGATVYITNNSLPADCYIKAYLDAESSLGNAVTTSTGCGPAGSNVVCPATACEELIGSDSDDVAVDPLDGCSASDDDGEGVEMVPHESPSSTHDGAADDIADQSGVHPDTGPATTCEELIGSDSDDVAVVPSDGCSAIDDDIESA
jgi:hypothetical protein